MLKAERDQGANDGARSCSEIPDRLVRLCSVLGIFFPLTRSQLEEAVRVVYTTCP